MSAKNKPDVDPEIGGEEGDNIYYCPKCGEVQTIPPPRCRKCDTPLEPKSDENGPVVGPEI